MADPTDVPRRPRPPVASAAQAGGAARPSDGGGRPATPDEPARRRRRVRHPVDAEPFAAAVAVTADADDPVPTPPPPTGDGDASPAERGLRGLIGGGSSQVKPTAALRARDAARPRESDLARAEAELTIVRRNWMP